MAFDPPALVLNIYVADYIADCIDYLIILIILHPPTHPQFRKKSYTYPYIVKFGKIR